MAFNENMRIEAAQLVGSSVYLSLSERLRREEHLPLQVRDGHGVMVDDAERSDAGRSQILEDRASEPAGADHEDTGRLELCLTGPTDLPQHDMSRVTLDLLAREVHLP